MNQTAAMAKSLLKGEVLSVMNCFKWFGVTNCAREIGRSIERKFDVEVSRVQKEALGRYEQKVNYYEYRLNRTDYNREGILKMEAYVSEIEQEHFKSIVKRGAKTKHVKSYVPQPVASTSFTQNSLFDPSPTVWDTIPIN